MELDDVPLHNMWLFLDKCTQSETYFSRDYLGDPPNRSCDPLSN